MTSELKPSTFVDELRHAVESGMKTRYEELLLQAAELIDAKNTRAVPDVPELVRYERTVTYEQQEHLGMVEHRYGDYVLHSQAAEIIAADRATLEQAKKEINTLLVSYVREHFFENKTFQPLDSLIGQISQLDNAITITRDFKSRAEAAEAKLAQYEAQEPVAYIQSCDLKWLSHDNYGSITITTSKSLTHTEPLYAAPVPEKD